MKKHLLILLSIVTFIQTKAQTPVVFCPPGAEWHYSFYLWGVPPAYGNEQIKYTGDSIVGTDTVKILSHYDFFLDYNVPGYKTTLLKQRGDTVFMKSAITQNNWQVLYNYGAQPGQSWLLTINYMNGTTPSTQTVNYSVLVDSVSYTIVNGFNLRVLHVKYYSPFPGSPEQVTITERFGNNDFLFRFHNMMWVSDDDFFLEPLCYQDSAFGTKQFSGKPCDFTGFAGLEELNGTSGIAIYPNPVRGVLTLQTSEAEALQVQLTDVCGRQVLQQTLNAGENEHSVDVESLSPGVYVLSVYKERQLLYRSKQVKQ